MVKTHPRWSSLRKIKSISFSITHAFAKVVPQVHYENLIYIFPFVTIAVQKYLAMKI